MDTRAGWARARAWPCKVRGGGSFEITIASYNLQISAAMVRRRQDENFYENPLILFMNGIVLQCGSKTIPIHVHSMYKYLTRSNIFYSAQHTHINHNDILLWSDVKAYVV